ncbi:MAG TPA: molybdate ABC transporter substrate-binding protein [Rhizomicrobium sp.]|nr:molybdate ABC transporter substrate-binding protein [Rhizomicrobium sp.]
MGSQRTLGILALLLAFVVAGPSLAGDRITVFAAASLTDALNAVDAAWRARTGADIVVSFASSSTLARQIEAGAPAEIFLCADTKWTDYLDRKGLIEPGTRHDVLGNRLALIAPSDSPVATLSIDRTLDWQHLLGADGHLAVGDPDHVPAGIYAKEALTSLGAWDALKQKLARADDVRGALALVEHGEAPLGIVYVTDARVSRKVKIVGVFPETSHSPIVYPFAIVKGQASPAVKAYFRFLNGAEARSVFSRYGFATP